MLFFCIFINFSILLKSIDPIKDYLKEEVLSEILRLNVIYMKINIQKPTYDDLLYTINGINIYKRIVEEIKSELSKELYNIKYNRVIAKSKHIDIENFIRIIKDPNTPYAMLCEIFRYLKLINI